MGNDSAGAGTPTSIVHRRHGGNVCIGRMMTVVEAVVAAVAERKFL
jgi:hypothetical protein